MILKFSLKFVTAVVLGILAFSSVSSLSSSASAARMVKKSEIPIMQQLRLDEKQKRIIQSSRTRRTIAIKKILTKDQGLKFDQLRSKQNLSTVISQLNLDAKQKTAVMAVIQQTQKEIKEILNITQKRQLEAYLARNRETAE